MEGDKATQRGIPILRTANHLILPKDKQLRILWVALCLSCGFLQGCIFDPKKGDEKPPPPQSYERPISPSAVIRNLALAYKQKDSVNYVACYDLNYTGSSIDQLDPTPQLISVTWADEADHIGALARSAIASIDVTTFPNLDRLRFHDSNDPSNYETMHNPLTLIQIVDNSGNGFSVPLDKELTIFKFIGTPNSGATDSTWKVISWEEVRSTP